MFLSANDMLAEMRRRMGGKRGEDEGKQPLQPHLPEKTKIKEEICLVKSRVFCSGNGDYFSIRVMFSCQRNNIVVELSYRAVLDAPIMLGPPCAPGYEYSHWICQSTLRKPD